MLTRRDILSTSLLIGMLILIAMAIHAGLLTAQFTAILLVIGSTCITAANWRLHQNGRCPTFIFLVLGILFLCGRAVPAIVGETSLLSRVAFGREFNVADRIVEKYVLLVLASFLFIHIGSLFGSHQKNSSRELVAGSKLYLALFIFFLPLYIYKNVYYFKYIMANGGYLAIYQGSDHLAGVGAFVRLGSLFCMAAFTLYFFHENDKIRARRALILFVILFAAELLVGLRGKFFVVSLVFFLYYKLRFDGSFSIKGMLLIAITVILTAISVEVAREQKDESTVGGSLLTGFLVQQGVTAGVTMTVLDEIAYFSKNGGNYFARQFLIPFFSQTDIPMGWALATDVSLVTMPEAYSFGFGSGSSYLSELFLLGGWAGVLIGSALVGFILRNLGSVNNGVSGALGFWVVCGLVYYPRTMLHDPLHNLLRYAVPILILVLCCWALKRFNLGYFNAT